MAAVEGRVSQVTVAHEAVLHVCAGVAGRSLCLRLSIVCIAAVDIRNICLLLDAVKGAAIYDHINARTCVLHAVVHIRIVLVEASHRARQARAAESLT